MYSHKTVFLKQAVLGLVEDNLSLTQSSTQSSDGPLFMDATLGGGGHTRAILESVPNSRVVAVDWDHKAIANAFDSLSREFLERLVLIHSNFTDFKAIEEKTRYFTDYLKKDQELLFNGILADFGTSQNQIANDDGFSFSSETILDMRMSKAFNRTQARDIVAHASEKELFKIFSVYGEDSFSRLIARTIVERRKIKPIVTTLDLANLISKCVTEKTGCQYFKIHPATKAFQALRIVVNDELVNIEKFVKAAAQKLAPGGRLVCITFHSLEDRIVKNAFREIAQDNLQFKVVTKKPLESTDLEKKENKSCRSAKLRILQKQAF